MGALAAVIVLVSGAAGIALAAFTATTSNGPSSFSIAAPDTTDPVIARSTAMLDGGSTAGRIRQGGGYYVYAEVTDASSIASVTADMTTVDTGVSAASLATAGGPWTVGGLSYNYRSALLTANTPITTGAAYAYSISAADTPGNSDTQNYSVAVETYEQVVEGTSGLISFWRMGINPFVADTFTTGAAGATIQSRAGEVGATWTKHAWSNKDAVLSDVGRMRKSGTGHSLYYASGVPSSANYAVDAELFVKTLATDDMAGVAGRISTSADTFYLARYEVASGSWNLMRVSAGSWTWLGGYTQALSAGSTYNIRLAMDSTPTATVKFFVDGVQRISVNENTITATGRGGVLLGDDAITGATVSNTVGMHIDNLRVVSQTGTTMADSFGANPGTFTNGPMLNVAGALVGDYDGATRLNGTSQSTSTPDSASLGVGDVFTLEAWVKRHDSGTGTQTIAQNGTNGFHWSFVNNRMGLYKDNSGKVVETTTTQTDQLWHHYVATKNGATVALYVDGVDVTGTVTNLTIANPVATMHWGAKGGTWEYLNATIDEAAIYSSALSAATVQAHYNAGKGTG